MAGCLLIVAFYVGPLMHQPSSMTPTPTVIACPCDLDRNHAVTIDEIVRGVSALLHGCP